MDLAKRFAQDDDFVGACNIAVWMCRKDERAKKSQALGMTERGEWAIFG